MSGGCPDCLLADDGVCDDCMSILNTQTAYEQFNKNKEAVFCLPTCKTRDKDASKTRCSSCMTMFHDSCVNIPPEYGAGESWQCDSCSRMPAKIDLILKYVQSLVETNTKIRTELSAVKKDNEIIKKDNEI